MRFVHRLISPAALVLFGGMVAWFLSGCAREQAPDEGSLESDLSRARLEQFGFLDVVRGYGADPTGARDSTEALQRAIDAAMVARKVVFFPPGRYLVSDTLKGLQPPADCGFHTPEGSYVWVGSSQGSARPTLVLAPDAEGFDTPTAPKPMVHIWKEGDGRNERASCVFGSGLRNLDLDLGGHAGAVGILFDAAQDSFLEHLTIRAEGAFAGVTGMPGRGAAVSDLEVQGGQYGIRTVNPLNGEMTSLGTTLVGVRLYGQTVRALFTSAWRGLQVSGFRIHAAAGPVIETAGTSEEGGNLALFDGVIRLESPSVAVDNTAGRAVSMRNVFLFNASAVIDNPGVAGEAAGVPSGWAHVKEYGHCEADLGKGVGCANQLDGRVSTADLVDVAPSSGPDAAIVQRHLWAGSPSFESADVVKATAFGATPDDASDDDAVAIQRAIDAAFANGRAGVFLPAGQYDLEKPIQLKASTHLFGVPGRRSVLHAKDSWTDTLSAPAWVVETVDDAAATTSLEHVVVTSRNDFGRAGAGVWLGAVHWRVGRRSVLRNVRSEQLSARWEDTARQIFRISGSGGGRWYAWGDHLNIPKNAAVAEASPGFRKLVIEGTTEPLTFYGFNPEHGGNADHYVNPPFVELRGAANVRILGSKTEQNGPILRVSGASRNLYLGSVWGHGSRSFPGAYLEVEAPATDVEMNHVAWVWRDAAPAPALVRESGYGAVEAVPRNALLGTYRRGRVDWSAW